MGGYGWTIDFDNQSGTDRGEIDDVVTDRMLSPEVHPQLVAVQPIPEVSLGAGHVGSQVAQLLTLLGVNAECHHALYMGPVLRVQWVRAGTGAWFTPRLVLGLW